MEMSNSKLHNIIGQRKSHYTENEKKTHKSENPEKRDVLNLNK